MKRGIFYLMFLVIFSFFLAGCGTQKPPVGDYEAAVEDMEMSAVLQEELDRMTQVEQLKPKILSDVMEAMEEMEDMK